MPRYLPDVPRHVIFGDATNPNKLHLVPESQVRFELHQDPQTRERTCVAVMMLDNKRITMPKGAQASFIQIHIISENGGHGFPEAADEAPSSNVPPSLSGLPGFRRS